MNRFPSGSNEGATGSGSGLACVGSPSEKSHSLTEMMSAKSAPSSIPTRIASSCVVTLVSATWSCIPSPTNRSRLIDTESSGRFAVSGFRRKNAAE